MDYLPQDGRYLLINHTKEEFTLTPGPPEEITRRLQQAVATVRPGAASAPGMRRAPAWDEADADDEYYRQRNERGWNT
ncbi:hypothetical protein [Nocardia grenadensis]|uniref:hypothetical protein n=1 Tax=Nocardia grenadensis TaxID=931537 RepID=UPI00157D0033|nr:hypothetical protein [Nocardia grenadensis]